MEQSQIQRVDSGCGIQGCLFGAVALFVLLLIAMLIVGIFRFSQPPQSPLGPPAGVEGQRGPQGSPPAQPPADRE